MAIAISRRSNVEPFHAMDILAEANRLRGEGRSIISMAVGQPADPAPVAVREAARLALEDGRIGYTDALGLRALRQAVAAHYQEHYGLDVSPDRVAITTGSSAGFNLAFMAMFDQGDRVGIAAPGYPAYRNIMAALGLEVMEIRLEGKAYLTAEMIEEEHKRAPLKGLLFASPANPTGASIPRDELAKLVKTATDLGIATISDEIYHRLNFTGPDHSSLEFAENVTVINSFSKYYCMTGWRIGWMVLPEPLVRPIERIQQSLYISPPELSQLAAVAAFSATDELEAVKKRYAANRAILAQALPAMGFPLASPMDGAFYAYCDVSRLTNDSMQFARRMLEETGVAATPGRDFDPELGHRFMRFSYAGSTEEMAQATDRIADWLR